LLRFLDDADRLFRRQRDIDLGDQVVGKIEGDILTIAPIS